MFILDLQNPSTLLTMVVNLRVPDIQTEDDFIWQQERCNRVSEVFCWRGYRKFLTQGFVGPLIVSGENKSVHSEFALE